MRIFLRSLVFAAAVCALVLAVAELATSVGERESGASQRETLETGPGQRAVAPEAR